MKASRIATGISFTASELRPPGLYYSCAGIATFMLFTKVPRYLAVPNRGGKTDSTDETVLLRAEPKRLKLRWWMLVPKVQALSLFSADPSQAFCVVLNHQKH